MFCIETDNNIIREGKIIFRKYNEGDSRHRVSRHITYSTVTTNKFAQCESEKRQDKGREGGRA